jgi:hypothetical protein
VLALCPIPLHSSSSSVFLLPLNPRPSFARVMSRIEFWIGICVCPLPLGAFIIETQVSVLNPPATLSTWQHATWEAPLLAALTTTAMASSSVAPPPSITLPMLLTPTVQAMAALPSPVHVALSHLARGRLALGWGTLVRRCVCHWRSTTTHFRFCVFSQKERKRERRKERKSERKKGERKRERKRVRETVTEVRGSPTRYPIKSLFIDWNIAGTTCGVSTGSIGGDQTRARRLGRNPTGRRIAVRKHV